jgi:DNA repair exonuclease SbcCD ATPase subunit
LAVIFAFRKLAESKNICNTNLIFFDEILDSSLDAEGMESVASILETFEDKSIFVISHRENVSDIFDRTIRVQMKNNYSTIA